MRPLPIDPRYSLRNADSDRFVADRATLYIVATPIGNLRDITLRALDLLASVDRIFCEDTRRSRKLLNHYVIVPPNPLESLRSANQRRQSARVVRLLRDGDSVAYLTDAGTPGINDPGAELAHRVRSAGFPVAPMPGVSAVTTLMSVGGVPCKGFLFDGFLSTRPGRRRKRLTELVEQRLNAVLFESPHRLLRLLDELCAINPQCWVVVGRELTKLHEEMVTGTPAELRRHFGERDAIRGELTLLVINRKTG